ncbi:DeoR/GlpR family DNA-binding transcription regulator [Crossiella cryophila]|uniref:Lactose phosphotransferase system repressor n=1 Tax=Crossiella cryophila TaxID=43355 RepID=A0A7W7CCS2_9PSEU|nr:DeoR/GlpR family DNA-binding transcription regulator [Crossiella cryophila]MBB4678719.1 DeoR/GlpR family transcriptional regulator of sugar metabolism [Crossiella cryophila]
MQAGERQQAILQLLNARGRLTIAELSTRMSVSDMTIRRDLAQLESDGLLSRTHGGAIRLQSGSFEPPLALRTRLHAEAKRAIAAEVAGELVDGQTLVLDGGSTGMAIAEALLGRRLTVCALNLRVADILAASAQTTVMVPGGRIRPEEHSFIGPSAERTLADHRFDTFVMTVSALDVTAGLTEWNVEDAAVKRAALASSGRCLVACDSSKFGQTAFARIGGLDAADLIVTDAALDAEAGQAVQAGGTLLRLA